MTLLFCLAFGARAARAQQPPAAPINIERARSLAGCWAIVLGAWSQLPKAGPAHPTTRFRLDSVVPTPRWYNELVAERLAPEESAGERANRWRKPPRWRIIGRDSVEAFLWLTSFDAEVLYAHVVGDSLVGVVRRTSDGIPIDPVTRRLLWDSWPWARATATRVACDGMQAR